MGSETISSICTRARLYADERPGGSAAFVTDTEVSSIVVQSIKKLRQLLTLERGHDLFTSTSSFATVNGTSAYTLPTDYAATLRVRLVWGAMDHEDVHPCELAEQSDITDWSTWQQYGIKRYRVRNGSLEFVPAPTAAVSVEHLYEQGFDTSATSADLRIEAWDEWVALDTAVRMLQLQGKAHNWLAADRDNLGEQLKRAAQDRVVEDAVHIVDRGPARRIAVRGRY